uniref:Bifunctional inhibitor/plant lipid transfer protein/seed storage helical domain-containing protein n=1 Tax=Leersia perrieri TaxID=77586 RepID=A0A0D9VX89_9ORYZ
MERCHHHHLLLGVLLLAAGAAEGIAEAQAAPQQQPRETAAVVDARCELYAVATQLALHCLPAADADTDATPAAPVDAQCCSTVSYAVHLDSGFRCLCAAAAQQQLVIGGLSSARLLALYASCGGRRPVDSRLAAACAAMARSGDVSAEACDPANLADQVTRYCGRSPDAPPTAQCCEPVVATVDLAGGGEPSCLCRELAEPRLVVAGAAMNATGLLAMYTACGGLRAVGADVTDGCIHPRTRSTTAAKMISAAYP